MQSHPYSGLEPATLWRHFAALNEIPRPSGHEHAAREYVHSVAAAAGAESAVDAGGNTVVHVAARGGHDDAPIVAIQTHLDMVCTSAPGVEHDFEREPIVPRRDGARIFASGTTLGADNGIGVAAALALLSDPVTVHGPLELVFTVEEETGLRGAIDLDASALRAQVLVNLDSEDDQALTVGSAGGANVMLSLPISREPSPPGLRGAELRISGLTGGHSGMQIHERHANAIKLAVAVLDRLREANVEYRIESFTGGSAHNAIAPHAAVSVLLPGEAADAVVARAAAELREQWADCEPELVVGLLDRPSAGEVMAGACATSLTDLLRSLPHGVISMSQRFPGAVETSANLAVVRSEERNVEILTSVRSHDGESLNQMQQRIRALGEDAGAGSRVTASYPAWPPREHSPLLACTVEAYRRVHGREPRIDIVHGGLECGVIVANKPNLDAVSFGPLIKGAHTPTEHVYASTVLDTWRVLVTLLANLTTKGA